MGNINSINYLRPDSGNLPLLPLPFYAYCTGIHTATPSYTQYNEEINRSFVELLWCVKGIGEIEFYGTKYEIHSNDIFFCLPFEKHKRKALSPEWEVRWLAFDGPFAESIMLSYRYARHQKAVIPYPAETFAEIEKLIIENSPFAMRKLLSLILYVLACAGGTDSSSNYTGKYFKHAQHLINSQISDPFLDINSICNTLKISRMKLTKIFNESVGVPPGRYILNRRLALAQSLLTGTDLPISEIAERCGFANSQTFLKFIRRSLGASPLEIREINRQKGSSTVYGKNIQKKMFEIE